MTFVRFPPYQSSPPLLSLMFVGPSLCPVKKCLVMLVTRTIFLSSLLALWFFADSEALSQEPQPNIVFIIADDLRYDLLGCNGHPDAITPNIDRLASEGVNFSNFFVTTPLCSPSRATFLTGLYPHSHRIVNNDSQGLDVKSHRLMTFPRILSILKHPSHISLCVGP